MDVENLPNSKKRKKSVEMATVDVEHKSKSAKSVSTQPIVAKSKPKAAGSNKRKYQNAASATLHIKAHNMTFFAKGDKGKRCGGCDKSACDYWTHASCVNLLIKPKVSVEKYKSLYPNHR